MKLVLDVDNTLYRTMEYLKIHQLLSAPMREIPYWSFYKVDDVQLQRDIFLFKSIPLRVLNKNNHVLDFWFKYARFFEKIIILTGRHLTNEEKNLIKNDLQIENDKIKYIDDVDFTGKLGVLDELTDYIVFDDYTGIESFIRDLHESHNAFYVHPDIDLIAPYTREVFLCLFEFEHMWFNYFLYPREFRIDVKQKLMEILKM